MAEDRSRIAKLTALIGSLALTAVAPEAGLPMILGNMAINLSSQYIYDLFNPRWQQLWQGKDGILNHDIQKALVAALQTAYQQIAESYTELHKPDESEKKAIADFITVLSAEAEQRLLQPDAESNPVGAQELLSYLSFTQETQIYPQLQERLQLLTNPPNEWETGPLSAQFLQYFEDNLGGLVKEAFIAQLTANPIAKEKLTLLYFEVLNQSVMQGNEQIMNALQTVQTQTTHNATYAEIWVSAIRRFNERFEELKQGQERILNEVKSLPHAVQQAVADGFKQLSTAAVLPDFMASERYKKLKNQLQQLQTGQQTLAADIAEIEEDINSQPEGRIKERLKTDLRNLQTEQLQKDKTREDTQKELETFVRDVLALAQTLGSIDATQSPRLQEARRLFEEGDFEAANNTLNEKAIDDEIQAAKTQLENLANELQLKAQITALNKTQPHWFEEAKRLYEKGVATHSSYQTCFACAYFLAAHNQHNQAIDYYTRALPLAENERQKADILNNLGILLKAKNEFPEALLKYEEALEIYRNLAQANPQTYLPDVAMTLNNLGVLQQAKNEFTEALLKYEEALEIYRNLAQANPQTWLPDVAMTLNNLGLLLKDMNEFTEASLKYEEALEIRRNLAQANPQTWLPDVAMTLNNLGLLHYAKNEFTEALLKYEEALEIYRKLAQANPQTWLPDVATTLNNLAALHYAKNEFTEALLKYEEALEIRRNLAQANPQTYLPDVAMTLNNLGLLLADTNEFTEALLKYEEALEISRNLAQANPQTWLPKVAMTLNNLGILLKAKNEFTEALLKYEEALEIYRNLAQANPQTWLPDVAMTLNNLGVLLKDMNEFTEALLKYEEALEIYRNLAQANPQTWLPDVAMTLNNLGLLLKDMNEFTEASLKYEEALEIRRNLAQANPQTWLPDVAMTLNNLGVLLKDMNEFTEALLKYEEALEISRNLAQANPQTWLPKVAMTLNNLGILLKAKNEFTEALLKYEEALEIYRNLAQANPQTYLPDVAMTLNNLGVLLKDMNEFTEALLKYEEALEIRRNLAQANPQTWLPDVAMTLNNLGNLLKAKNEFTEALLKYEEALQIYRNLAQANPQTWLPNVAMTAMNLSIFYINSIPDKEISLQYAKEALIAAKPFGNVPRVQGYVNTLFKILQYWGIDPQAFIAALDNET